MFEIDSDTLRLSIVFNERRVVGVERSRNLRATTAAIPAKPVGCHAISKLLRVFWGSTSLQRNIETHLDAFYQLDIRETTADEKRLRNYGLLVYSIEDAGSSISGRYSIEWNSTLSSDLFKNSVKYMFVQLVSK